MGGLPNNSTRTLSFHMGEQLIDLCTRITFLYFLDMKMSCSDSFSIPFHLCTFVSSVAVSCTCVYSQVLSNGLSVVPVKCGFSPAPQPVEKIFSQVWVEKL